MKRFARKGGLAASFVVVTVTPACKKTQGSDPDPEGPSKPVSAYVWRNGTSCSMSEPMGCPKNVMCNPPPPEQVDCPADKREEGDPPAITRRPPGKADWIRVRPMLQAWDQCRYVPERFCAPPGKPYECTPASAPIDVACTKIQGDAGIRYKTEAFVWKDVLGVCHKIPSQDCAQGGCPPPDGDPVACP